MVELADTSDLGSDAHRAWRFESSYPHLCFFERLTIDKRRVFSFLERVEAVDKANVADER